ncbi:MAG: hydrogenase nickel incorporation protein HypB [Phycisphaerae bacterium]|jgi:hydrogenase nickel incorporation protein HypB
MRIHVVESVLKANDAVAAVNRRRIEEAGALAINVMSAPGSGKTTLLEKTIPRLAPARCAVLVGDLQTTRDAERIAGVAADVAQINTGTGCHLTATQVADGLARFELERMDYVLIENVGNMVCPAGFDLGEHLRVVLLSVPEGDDKVAKYPGLFQQADIVLLTKVDLLSVLDFDQERVREDLSRIQTRAPLLRLSARTGEGMDEWVRWVQGRRRGVAR